MAWTIPPSHENAHAFSNRLRYLRHFLMREPRAEDDRMDALFGNRPPTYLQRLPLVSDHRNEQLVIMGGFDDTSVFVDLRIRRVGDEKGLKRHNQHPL